MIQTGVAVLVVAWTTALEALRNRLLLVAVSFAVVLMGLSVAAASVSMGERARLILDVGLAAASGLGSIIAATLMITTFAGELQHRTAYVVLVRPLPRWAFVLGKFCGVLITMVSVVTLMILATAGIVRLYGDAIPAALWGSLWLTYVEMAVVSAIALLFGTLAVPAMAATYTAGVIIAGNLTAELDAFATQLRADNAGLARLIKFTYYALPDLAELSLRSQTANNMPIPKGVILYGTQYGAAYTLTALALAMLVFGRRKII